MRWENKMEKITPEMCINLLKEKFPKFLPYWDSYVSYWGMDQGITIQMMPFSEYVVDVIKSNVNDEIRKIFDFVELVINDAATFVNAGFRNAIPRFAMSFAFACAVALPESVIVAVVVLVPVTTAVRPAGTLATE